ncbi:TPA: hypothetical protein ACW5VC_002962 [Yersinia enterocolitica]
MEFNDVIFSRVGTVVTFLCAFGSAYSWFRSSQSATKAEKAVDKINYQRKILDASSLYDHTTRILKVVGKIGSAANKERIRGLDTDEIANELSEYITLVLENTYDVETKEKLSIDPIKFCDDIKQDIENLVDAVSLEDKLKYGRAIQAKIFQFSPQLKSLTNKLTLN